MKNRYSSSIFIFTALECEAKAIINQFKLKKENVSHPFSIYKNDKFILTVTGIGKVAMAGGVSYTLALFSKVPLPILINIGIAGHKTKAIGQLILASKIVDVNSEKVFYPQLIGDNWPETIEIRTTPVPNTTYSDDYLNDMEASAFFEIAVKFSSSELIHCLKIVSDNEKISIDNIQAKTVIEWIANHGNAIEKFFSRLVQLRISIMPMALRDYDKIIDQWHFTVSGQIKLKTLLRRWTTLSSNQWINEDKFSLNTAKEVLRQLETDIEHLKIIL